jgi:hypothetical protein
MPSYCSFLLQSKHKTTENTNYLSHKHLQSRFLPCTFHISECHQYLLVDDNIETLELKVQMPRILSQTLLYHHQPSYDSTKQLYQNLILSKLIVA